MEYTIKEFRKITYLLKNKEIITLNGYSFIDQCGHCFIIVYGERRRDILIGYLLT